MAAEPSSEGRERPVWYVPRVASPAPPVEKGDIFARGGLPGTWTAIEFRDLGDLRAVTLAGPGGERWTTGAAELTEERGVRRLEAPVGFGWLSRSEEDGSVYALLVKHDEGDSAIVGRAHNDGEFLVWPAGDVRLEANDTATPPTLDAAKRAVHVALALASRPSTGAARQAGIEPICLCPPGEYDPPCPRHGVVGLGCLTPAEAASVEEKILTEPAPARAAEGPPLTCLCNHLNAYACAEAPRRGEPHDCACHRAAAPVEAGDRLPDPASIALSPEAAEIDEAVMAGDVARLGKLAERHLRERRRAEAERDRLLKLFDDAGQGEYNVLALIDHYQGELFKAQRERDDARAAAVSDDCMRPIGRLVVALRLGPGARGLEAVLSAAADALERRPAPAADQRRQAIENARAAGDVEKAASLAHLYLDRAERAEAMLDAAPPVPSPSPEKSRTLATVSSPAADLGDMLTGQRALPLDPVDAARAYAERLEALVEVAVRRATAGTVPREAYEVSERQRMRATFAEERLEGELAGARRRVAALERKLSERAGGIEGRGGAMAPALDVDLVLSSARTLTKLLQERRKHEDALVMLLADQLAAAVEGEAGR